MSNSVPTPVFSFQDHQIRTIIQDGEPWFVGKDIALLLGYTKTDKEIRRICKYVKLFKGTNLVPLKNAPRGILIIPEADVWRLITRSTLDKAQEIEEWIMSEVLPAIRKTGKYEAKPQQKALPEPTPAALTPGNGDEWRGPELMKRIDAVSKELFIVYEEICTRTLRQYDKLHKLEPAEVSGLSAMLYAIRASKDAQMALLHSFNQWVYASYRRKGIELDAYDKSIAVSEIRKLRLIMENMMGWDIPDGNFKRL